jgi:hypothetical protein
MSGYIDNEPEGRHDARCLVWLLPGPVLDPEEDCDCRDLDGHMRDFHTGVQEKVDRFESYAGRVS